MWDSISCIYLEITLGFCLSFLSSNSQLTDKLLQKPSKTHRGLTKANASDGF